MSSPRLQQQFIRLWQHFQGQTTDTTLQELTGVLNCSRRHIRSLLNAMQQAGWLIWQAEAGRGKRSQLSFVYTGLALQQQRAEDLLEQDRIEQLVQLVGDKEAVRQMLLAHLGRSFRQGKHILRILYYRPLRNLLPSSALRRSEMHIARQIFSGLTNINEENGELKPDLAHHWQGLSPLHWRFYLRPAIRFHHGRELTMDDITTSLSRLTPLPLFSHIEAVTSPMPFVIDIRLSTPDKWLPWLLASVHAMILPQEWQTLPNFAQHPIGTGPYAVVRNNSSQLKIRAFDDYFGYRALIDEVNIWVLPDEPEEMPVSVQFQSDDSHHEQLESRMEEGGYFLLFDKRSPLNQRPEALQWLRQIFNPISLLSHANTSNQRDWSPAYSLLPRWHHHRPDTPQSIPDGLTDVTLTFYQEHPEYRILSEIMRTLLAQQGVTLHVQTISYEDWYQGNAESDIWFGSLNCYLPLEFSLFAMLYELPLVQHCLNDDLATDAQQWRNHTLPMAEWSEKLIKSGQLHPLLHHWLQLQGQRSMRGVRMNMLGWFDFKSAWFAPPER
ncbi:HTH-type transcriptional regulator SgrR [Pectobacterium parmentieri]|uniref:HTH-type transcriptional regulator SgrR n=1 Tax=Pectobacterium parmentieri TaxID=1905730 RepID=A0A0H3I952_PECPM|nr:HTH-type transcriptional regulator SgrR [Pectobacterium parmentieri]ACX89539.1 extracellular solute-binding protein family 5 [Pectobacterium parmentieri WPP163]AFI92008.1 HTH-type transcriptional regulator sgrR [Pectobacterium parmentieri]MBI0469034.1 HTH-type transcriptional regulator SgrR [Pectobacterium parmentieri]MBI0491659.1 HTH-type transcriptional regulator SgrR [Pectobacterium parmentieri]MBI0554440.1 HTH-type transcriptional regulator SgrR [Pectobacterium parmentieri]